MTHSIDLGSASLDVLGSVDIEFRGDVTTTGNLNFAGAVTLNSVSTEVMFSGTDVTFGDTVDSLVSGEQSMIVNASKACCVTQM